MNVYTKKQNLMKHMKSLKSIGNQWAATNFIMKSLRYNEIQMEWLTKHTFIMTFVNTAKIIREATKHKAKSKRKRMTNHCNANKSNDIIEIIRKSMSTNRRQIESNEIR